MKKYKFTIDEAIEIIHQTNKAQKFALSSWYSSGRSVLCIPECLVRVRPLPKPSYKIYYQKLIWTGD
jgi:predicted metal-dependent TIM-barrel fold hydrolase